MLNLNQLRKLYMYSPLWIQKLYASIPYDIRNGNDYQKWRMFLNKELNEDEYQVLKMKELVSYAYDNTKYYKQVFDNFHIVPTDINDLSDFAKIPYIDKDTVRENYSDMLVTNYPKKDRFCVVTGGSSGVPMEFIQSKHVWKKELAFIMDFFSKYGYKPSKLKASFRGGEFNHLPAKTYWKYNPVNNELHFSPFHLNEHTIASYVGILNKQKPYFFHTYPSTILLLVDLMMDKGLKFTYQPKAIFLISENFSIENIEKIKLFFNCDVSAFYGHSERLIFAPSFSDDLSTYQVDKRYGLFELSDKMGKSIHANHLRGEMVGTGFDNDAMPLLRYKTGDFTQYVDYDNKIISQVEGRWTKEHLLGENKQKIYLTALNMHSDVFKNVIQYQFYQDRVAYVELHLIVNHFFKEKDKKNIVKELNKKAGHSIEFQVKIVEKLSLTIRGKYKKIISKEMLV